MRRNRRRYGGYIVHAGVAVALIGVAASTSFQHSRTRRSSPGQSVDVDGYRFSYVRPTATASPEDLARRGPRRLPAAAAHVTTLHTTYGLYPSQDPTQGPIGRFFNGSTRAGSASTPGLTRDIWTVIHPNIDAAAEADQQGQRDVQPGARRRLKQLPAGAARKALTRSI